MANTVRILHSSTAGARPTGKSFGELWVNDADKVLGYINATGNPVELGVGHAKLISHASVAINPAGVLTVHPKSTGGGTIIRASKGMFSYTQTEAITRDSVVIIRVFGDFTYEESGSGLTVEFKVRNPEVIGRPLADPTGISITVLG